MPARVASCWSRHLSLTRCFYPVWRISLHICISLNTVWLCSWLGPAPYWKMKKMGQFWFFYSFKFYRASWTSLLEPNQMKPQRNFKAKTQVETSELYCVIEIITYVACFLRNSSVSERAKRRPPCARICLRHFCFWNCEFAIRISEVFARPAVIKVTLYYHCISCIK